MGGESKSFELLVHHRIPRFVYTKFPIENILNLF